MVFSTPCVSAAAPADTAADATRPAATLVAALTVERMSVAGAPADAIFAASTAVRAPPDTTTPRRASLPANFARTGRAGRQPFLRDSRVGFGRLPVALTLQLAEDDPACGTSRASGSVLGREQSPSPCPQVRPCAANGSGTCGACLSRSRRLVLFVLAFHGRLVRHPVEPVTELLPGMTEVALRARTRKVAWKASSASWWSRSTRRQTPQTIGPCRCTRASKAALSGAASNSAGDRVGSSFVLPQRDPRPANGGSHRKCGFSPSVGSGGNHLHVYYYRLNAV